MCFLHTNNIKAQSTEALIDTTISYAKRTLLHSIAEVKDSTQHPDKTNPDGTWYTQGRNWWVSGFFPGTLWYMYLLSNKDAMWLPAARKWTYDMIPAQNTNSDHDVGFRMFNSVGLDYLINKSESNKFIILTSSAALMQRYDTGVGLIRSWGSISQTTKYEVIIDNMMNLEMLFWVTKNGGSSYYYDCAVSHALKTRENHIRADGSTYHVVNYNMDGTVKSKYTAQGAATESCWSRGQAWAIYGFTTTYRETKDVRFLETALKTADYFIDHLPADSVPYNDFKLASFTGVSKDASAAAIASSALFELSLYTTNAKYRKAAVNMLRALMRSPYLSKGYHEHTILRKCCVRYNEPELGLAYADYYLLEAILRYKGIFMISPLVTSTFRTKNINTGVSIYPNPLAQNSELTIDLGTNTNNAIFQIFDFNGKLQLKHDVNSVSKINIQTNKILQPGIYITKTTIGGQDTFARILVIQ